MNAVQSVVTPSVDVLAVMARDAYDATLIRDPQERGRRQAESAQARAAVSELMRREAMLRQALLLGPACWGADLVRGPVRSLGLEPDGGGA